MKDEFPAPSHLSDRSRSLWASIVPERGKSPGRLALLQAALEALDRADSAIAEIATAGLTTTTKTTGAVHVHPLVKVEREARAQFASIWNQLGLGFDAKLDKRPF